MPQRGFAPLVIIIIATILIGAGVGSFFVFREKKMLSSEKGKTRLSETNAVEEVKSPIEPTTQLLQVPATVSVERDPWRDLIPAAPTNLTLPIAIKDIQRNDELISPYGPIRHSRDGGIGHGGIDFPLAAGSVFYAVADGIIIKNNEEDVGGGKTVDILILPKKFRDEGWIFKYEHIALEPGLAVGSTVQRGHKIGTNAFLQKGNNHVGLEYHIKNFTISREKICWVNLLEPTARQQLENEFNKLKKTPAFIQSWQMANEEGYYQYRGLLDETKYSDGPQLCYSLGTDARIPLPP